MKSALAVVALSLFIGPVAGCDGGERKSIAEQIGPASKNLNEVKTAPKVSEEELAKRRKEAGFVSKEEADAKIAAENAKMFEKGDREFIKTRVKEYRALTADTRKLLDDIEQLTHIAGPAGADQQFHRLGCKAIHVLAIALRQRAQKVPGEQRDIVAPLFQRRNGQRDDIEPVVEVAAEAASAHLLFEVAMRGADDTDVDRLTTRGTHRIHLALFEHPQQLDLK